MSTTGPIDPPVPTCNRCGAGLFAYHEQPNKGSGCIVAALGLLLAPACIGIPLLIYGLSMVGETKTTWQCANCGFSFVAVPQYQQTAPTVEPPKPEAGLGLGDITVRADVHAVLRVLAIIGFALGGLVVLLFIAGYLLEPPPRKPYVSNYRILVEPSPSPSPTTSPTPKKRRR